LNPETLVVAFTKNAVDGLLLVGIDSGKVVPVPLDLVEIQPASVRRISNTRFTAVGSKATLPAALYHFDVESNVETVLRSTTSIALPQSIFSKAEAISFPRTYGKDKTGTSHALFLPPHNPSFSAPSGAKPPLIVSIHGGPTGHVAPGLSLTSQYWTSRGFAYVYVNYAGSTGYGRAYIESLNTLWGVQDVDDAASCVAFLAEKGWVDGSRVGITGGSAGGYTVLQALCTYPKLWAAGNSSYGIGNLKSLADMTHKFESHYLFALVFPEGTPKEEQEKVYWERSPCHHAEKIESPLLLLQGALDRVVPLDQAEEMERVLKEGKKDVKLVVFEGEGHGFRMQKNVKRAIEEEESLWKRTLLR
jgi:dipeptidyl aminopeptidase/acylaminoacyl peptidase